MSEKQKNNSIVMALCTLIVGLLGYMGTALTTAHSEREQLQKQIEVLQANYNKLAQENYTEKQLSYRLQLKLEQEINQRKLFQQFIDSVNVPMWIKQKDGKLFTILMINTAYEKAFDITKFQYHGRNDFDVYPFEVARNFQENDKKVFNSKRHICTAEQMPDNKTVDVCKFPILLESGKFGVGGIVLRIYDTELKTGDH